MHMFTPAQNYRYLKAVSKYFQHINLILIHKIDIPFHRHRLCVREKRKQR